MIVVAYILATKHTRSHISETPGFFAVILVPTVPHSACLMHSHYYNIKTQFPSMLMHLLHVLFSGLSTAEG